VTDYYLINSLILACVVMLAVVGLRYFRERDYIFWDSSTYFILLAILYVGIPAWIHLDKDISLVGASNETIRFSAEYSLYFLSVLIGYYAFKTFLPSGRQVITSAMPLSPISGGVIYLIYILIASYVFLVLFIEFPGINTLWANRSMASELANSINGTYKIMFLFHTVASMVLYLALRKKRMWYFWMLFPFLAIDLMTAGRAILYQSLMVWIVILLVNERKLPIVKLTLMSFLLVSVEMVRGAWTSGFFVFDGLWLIPGELLLTTEVGFINIESNQSVDILRYLVYSIGKVFSPQVMSIFFDPVSEFKGITPAEITWSTGLGGSLLAEVYSFKNTAMLIAYPFLAVVYLELVNYLRRVAGIFGIFIFLFYLMSTQQIFRTGFIFTGMEPIYYAIYSVFWYWFISIARKRISLAPMLKTSGRKNTVTYHHVPPVA
jgi:hypothetical protein